MNRTSRPPVYTATLVAVMVVLVIWLMTKIARTPEGNFYLSVFAGMFVIVVSLAAIAAARRSR